MATALHTPYDHLHVGRDLTGDPDRPLATVHPLPTSTGSESRAVFLRRRLVVALVTLLTVAALAMAFQSTGTAATGNTVTDTVGPALVPIASTVTLLPGQTLWELAVDATVPGEDPRVMLESIRQLNGFTSDLVPAYTTVAIPGE